MPSPEQLEDMCPAWWGSHRAAPTPGPQELVVCGADSPAGRLLGVRRRGQLPVNLGLQSQGAAGRDLAIRPPSPPTAHIKEASAQRGYSTLPEPQDW